MRFSSYGLVVLSVVVLAAVGYADIVVEEHSGYTEGEDYLLSWYEGLPRITILEPSTAQDGPYDFECYDDSTRTPYDPATILWIKADPNIGDVSIKVVGHADRTYGALNVDELHLDQAGVTSTVKEFKISGNLGDDNDTHVDVVAGTFEAKYIVSDMYAGTVANTATLLAINLEATLYVTGAGPHLGDIIAPGFESDGAIDVSGTMQGSISVGGT